MNNNLEQRVTELEKIVAELVRDKTTKARKSPDIGDRFHLAGLEWTVLDITDKGYLCLGDRLQEGRQFDGSSSDWQSSDLRKYLNSVL